MLPPVLWSSLPFMLFTDLKEKGRQTTPVGRASSTFTGLELPDRKASTLAPNEVRISGF